MNSWKMWVSFVKLERKKFDPWYYIVLKTEVKYPYFSWFQNLVILFQSDYCKQYNILITVNIKDYCLGPLYMATGSLAVAPSRKSLSRAAIHGDGVPSSCILPEVSVSGRYIWRRGPYQLHPTRSLCLGPLYMATGSLAVAFSRKCLNSKKIMSIFSHIMHKYLWLDEDFWNVSWGHYGCKKSI